MKKISIIILSFILFSCHKDPLVPCDCEGNYPGQVCREYYYEGAAYTKYIDYEYAGLAAPVKKSYHSINGNLNSSIILRYNEKLQLISESFFGSNAQQISSKYYLYNEFDSIQKITSFIGNTESGSIFYSYNDAHFLTQIVFNDAGSLSYFIKYEYDGEGYLWRTSRFNNDSVITGYTLIEYFNNDIIRETYYNSDTEITTYKVILYQNSKLQRINHYNRNLQIISWTVYSYVDQQLEKISNYNSQGTLTSFILFQYY